MKINLPKKCMAVLIALSLLITMAGPAYAADNSISVQVNGGNLDFDVAPQMINGRVLVPMRTIFEEFGATVDWDNQTRSITATRGDAVIKLALNSRQAFIIKDGVESNFQLDAAPVIVNGKTLVPVRFISQSLGKQVGWDSENRTVVIIDYAYFINALKTKASNFYDYANTQYGELKTGEMKGSADASFKYESGDNPKENVSGTINAAFDAKINEDNGTLDASIKMTGLNDFLKEMGLENIDNVTVNLCFDNNSFYVKSNLLSLLKDSGIDVGDKWVKADLAEMGVPNVKTLQDLKKMQTKQPAEQMIDLLANTPMQLDVNSFEEAKAVFNAVAALVDNKHFTVTKQGDMKVYKWDIQKQDLVDVVLNVLLAMDDADMPIEDLTVKDLIELKKFVDTMVFEYSAEIKVKNNFIVSSKASLNAKMDIPRLGDIEVTSKSNYEVLNINNTKFQISIPDPGKVLDYHELVGGMR